MGMETTCILQHRGREQPCCMPRTYFYTLQACGAEHTCARRRGQHVVRELAQCLGHARGYWPARTTASAERPSVVAVLDVGRKGQGATPAGSLEGTVPDLLATAVNKAKVTRGRHAGAARVRHARHVVERAGFCDCYGCRAAKAPPPQPLLLQR
eukprot:scaffold28638_cov95-Phaeocystis_antarctica.AAC.1